MPSIYVPYYAPDSTVKVDHALSLVILILCTRFMPEPKLLV